MRQSEHLEGRAELAGFLTRLRAGLQPSDVGLAGGGRRRVPGLRRHEIADLAGISLTWYTWLEQGRDIRISGNHLDALARAFKLEEPARRYLRTLGGCPDMQAAELPQTVDEGLKALIDDLSPCPCTITSPRGDFLAWNRGWKKVFVDLDLVDPKRRNGLWVTFMIPEYRERLADWDEEARYIVGRHREIAAPYASDPELIALHNELAERSPDFRRIWALNLVNGFVTRLQQVRHPELGTLRLKVMQMRPVDTPAIKVTVRRPADAITQKRLSKLL